MCGRYAFFAPKDAIIRAFGLTDGPAFPGLPERYNIAPTQTVPAVRVAQGGARELVPLRWGLIPPWADDPMIGSRMINARAETVREKPSFRTAFNQRRCAIPASGFYEWTQTANGKQPHFICRADREPLALAGLWETWSSKGDEETLQTCTIITTAANDFMQPLHHRMPVILDGFQLDTWLDPQVNPNAVAAILKPAENDLLEAWPVSRLVNSPKNDDQRLIEAIE
jgi:putative SOS response-associated peptidase YedK